MQNFFKFAVGVCVTGIIADSVNAQVRGAPRAAPSQAQPAIVQEFVADQDGEKNSFFQILEQRFGIQTTVGDCQVSYTLYNQSQSFSSVRVDSVSPSSPISNQVRPGQYIVAISVDGYQATPTYHDLENLEEEVTQSATQVQLHFDPQNNCNGNPYQMVSVTAPWQSGDRQYAGYSPKKVYGISLFAPSGGACVKDKIIAVTSDNSWKTNELFLRSLRDEGVFRDCSSTEQYRQQIANQPLVEFRKHSDDSLIAKFKLHPPNSPNNELGRLLVTDDSPDQSIAELFSRRSKEVHDTMEELGVSSEEIAYLYLGEYGTNAKFDSILQAQYPAFHQVFVGVLDVHFPECLNSNNSQPVEVTQETTDSTGWTTYNTVSYAVKHEFAARFSDFARQGIMPSTNLDVVQMVGTSFVGYDQPAKQQFRSLLARQSDCNSPIVETFEERLLNYPGFR